MLDSRIPGVGRSLAGSRCSWSRPVCSYSSSGRFASPSCHCALTSGAAPCPRMQKDALRCSDASSRYLNSCQRPNQFVIHATIVRSLSEAIRNGSLMLFPSVADYCKKQAAVTSPVGGTSATEARGSGQSRLARCACGMFTASRHRGRDRTPACALAL